MHLDTRHAVLPLQPQRPQRLDRVRGVRLRLLAGSAWVTVDHDPQDRVLAPGDTWTVDSAEPVWVSALGGPAELELCAPA